MIFTEQYILADILARVVTDATGSPSQVRQVTVELMRAAKERGGHRRKPEAAADNQYDPSRERCARVDIGG